MGSFRVRLPLVGARHEEGLGRVSRSWWRRRARRRARGRSALLKLEIETSGAAEIAVLPGSKALHAVHAVHAVHAPGRVGGRGNFVRGGAVDGGRGAGDSRETLDHQIGQLLVFRVAFGEAAHVYGQLDHRFRTLLAHRGRVTT